MLLPMCDIPALGLLLFTVVDAAVLWPCVAVGASGLFWLWAEGPRGGSMEQLMAVFMCCSVRWELAEPEKQVFQICMTSG